VSRTAQRRHDDARVLARRLRYPRYWWARGNQRMEGIYINTPVPCSCIFCTRRREMYGPTIQERRANLETWQYDCPGQVQIERKALIRREIIGADGKTYIVESTP